ncbi:MAG TPA: AAA family ATPase [Thermoplasmata archaeon]|nr:AAA family ATPase [Thermoplasmata archaeon]
MGTSRPPGRSDTAVALTGTPGTGKTSVGRLLRRSRPVVEVADLALREGSVRRRRGGQVEVRLDALSRFVARPGTLPDRAVVVGHLAHLLPLPDAVVLRCRPDALARRLRRAHRGTVRDRKENFLAEALDVVLLEARYVRRRVWEVDTTGRSVASVAAEVRDLIERRPRARFGSVDWLSDRRVAAHLLDPPG